MIDMLFKENITWIPIIYDKKIHSDLINLWDIIINNN